MHPAFFVPTLYFAEGLPYNVVNFLLANMYKNMGVSNTAIAFHTSLLVLAWTVKPLWSPVVEMFRIKREWVLAMEFGMAVLLGCVALAVPLPSFMPVTLAFMWIVAFFSATQDIAADGLYISVMNSREQSTWVGVQGFFWLLAKTVMTGSMVMLSGYLHRSGMSWAHSWLIVMLVCGAIMLLLGLWHTKFLPVDVRSVDRPTSFHQAVRTFKESFVSFFRKEQVIRIVAFIILYKISQGLIDRIGPLFLLDPRSVGGLGLDNVFKGSIDGLWGTAAMLGGTLLAGFFCARYSLNRWTLLLLCAALNVPGAVYVYMSHAMPTGVGEIYFLVMLDKFGMGFGEVGLMLYLMQQVAPGPFRTAHYAFGTGLMNLGYTVGGLPSGWVQEHVGYVTFFILVMICAIPSFVATWLAPFPVRYDKETGEQIIDPPPDRTG